MQRIAPGYLLRVSAPGVDESQEQAEKHLGREGRNPKVLIGQRRWIH